MSQLIDGQNTNDGCGGYDSSAGGKENPQILASDPVPQPPQQTADSKQSSSHCCCKKSPFNIGTAIELFLGLALIGVGYLQFCVYTRQAGIMQTQANIAVATDRPWVLAAIAPGALIFSDKGAHLDLQFTLKNTGHSPALHEIVVADMFADTNGGRIDGISELKTLCDRIKKARGTMIPGNPVFPGDQIVAPIVGVNISQEDMDNARRSMENTKDILPEIIACIDYGTPFDVESRQTGYVFRVSKKDPTFPFGIGHLDPSKGDIPASGLLLWQSPFGGGFAN
jgi:hypothetical protein